MMTREVKIDAYQIFLVVMVVVIVVLLIGLGAIFTATITADNMCRILGYDTGDINLSGLFSGNYVECNYMMPLEQIIQ